MKKEFYLSVVFSCGILAQGCNSQENTETTETETIYTDSVSTPTTDSGNDTTTITGVGGTTINNKIIDSGLSASDTILAPIENPFSK